MVAVDVSQRAQCPSCGADMPPAAERCWLCGQAPDPTMRLAATVSPTGSARGPRTFSLATLMLVVTFACVWLGATVQWPPIGIALAVLAVPALARAWWFHRAWRKAGAPMASWQSALSFVGSLLVMCFIAATAAVVLWVALVVAALNACSDVGVTPMGTVSVFWASLALGAVVALVVGGVLLWRLWIAQVRERRTTGLPPAAKQRVLGFLHAVLITFCTLTGAGAGGIAAMFSQLELWGERQGGSVLRTIVYLIGLAGFLGGGWLGYRLSRKDLRSAGPIAAGCLAIWLGIYIGVELSQKLRQSSAVQLPLSPLLEFLGRQAGWYVVLAALLYLLPACMGLAAYSLYFAAGRLIRCGLVAESP